MKRLSAFLIMILLIWLTVPTVHADGVQTSAAAYVLYCADNGRVLLSDLPDERLPMASTTKIMTALLTLEEAAKDNRAVTFTEEMTAEGSSMYLKVGEQVRLYDLAVGMLMQSGNDAANAAAITLAGSIEAFAKRMNRKARQIGMENTHFVTPSGLDDAAHYSTARDLAKLMAYAMQNKSFRRLTAQKSATVHFIKPAGKRVTYQNHNRLLSLYDGCIGGKTGYTMTAGRCLVTAAKRNGLTLIAVTLDDRDDWNDHAALYDDGFAHYTAVFPAVTRYRVPVVGGTADETTVSVAKNAGIVLPRGREKDLQTTVLLPPFLYAPTAKNTAVGRVICTLDGRTVGVILLHCDEELHYNSRRRGFFEYLADVLCL